jgi:hypothetical protein
MPSIQSPATILALLKKARAAYQKKEADPKAKAELRHKEIVTGLQRLRQLARLKADGPDGARLAKPFAARKKILLKKLTEHRKKLNGAEKNADPNKAQLAAFTKALLKITNAVLRLDFATATADEEEGFNLDRLEEGDPAALDRLDALSDADVQALEQQDEGELAETAEEEEGEAPDRSAVDRFKERAPQVKALLDELKTADGAAAAPLMTEFITALGHAKAGRFDQALALLQETDDAARAALAVAGGEEAAEQLDPAAALAAWEAAREQVVVEIRKAAAAVAATKNVHARAALIELQSIIRQLTPRPQTPQQVAELQRYLQTDQVITDAEALPSWLATLQIRAPLLKALAALKL